MTPNQRIGHPLVVSLLWLLLCLFLSLLWLLLVVVGFLGLPLLWGLSLLWLLVLPPLCCVGWVVCFGAGAVPVVIVVVIVIVAVVAVVVAAVVVVVVVAAHVCTDIAAQIRFSPVSPTSLFHPLPCFTFFCFTFALRGHAC